MNPDPGLGLGSPNQRTELASVCQQLVQVSQNVLTKLRGPQEAANSITNDEKLWIRQELLGCQQLVDRLLETLSETGRIAVPRLSVSPATPSVHADTRRGSAHSMTADDLNHQRISNSMDMLSQKTQDALLGDMTSGKMSSLENVTMKPLNSQMSLDELSGSSSLSLSSWSARKKKHRTRRSESFIVNPLLSNQRFQAASNHASPPSPSINHLPMVSTADGSHWTFERMFTLLKDCTFVQPRIQSISDNTPTSMMTAASEPPVRKHSVTLERTPLVLQSPLDILQHNLTEHINNTMEKTKGFQQEVSDFITIKHDGHTESLLRGLDGTIAELKSRLAAVTFEKNIAGGVQSILMFHPDQVAFQLSLIENAIFYFHIQSKDLLTTPSLLSTESTLHHSSDYFNYNTRLVEYTVLEPNSPEERGEVINFWISVQKRLYSINNLQTLKAITSALDTPPIKRLKQTWVHVSKKSIKAYEEFKDLLCEQNNYENYRQALSKIPRPAIPFLGVMIHDVAYLKAATKSASRPSSRNSSPVRGDSITTVMAPNAETRLHEVIFQMEYFQSGPPLYSSNLKRWICSSKTHRSEDYPSFVQSLSQKKSQGDAIWSCNPGAVVHWLLTRHWVTEKNIDQLSHLREQHEDKSRYSSLPRNAEERALHLSSGDPSTKIVASEPMTSPTSGQSRSQSALDTKLGPIEETVHRVKDYLHIGSSSLSRDKSPASRPTRHQNSKSTF